MCKVINVNTTSIVGIVYLFLRVLKHILEQYLTLGISSAFAERTMSKGVALVAFFLLFTTLSVLVQESYEITGILIPQRVPRCQRSRARRSRARRSCRRSHGQKLLPIFMVTEEQVKGENFLRYDEDCWRVSC